MSAEKRAPLSAEQIESVEEMEERLSELSAERERLKRLLAKQELEINVLKDLQKLSDPQ